MLRLSLLTCIISLSVCPAVVTAQSMQQREQEFLEAAPRVGDRLPDVTIFRPDGTSFRTGDLRGHHTVLTFGCLT